MASLREMNQTLSLNGKYMGSWPHQKSRITSDVFELKFFPFEKNAFLANASLHRWEEKKLNVWFYNAWGKNVFTLSEKISLKN